MNTNIIEELFYNLLTPDEDYLEHEDEMERRENNLFETFSDSQKELFKEYKTTRRNLEKDIVHSNFKYGFKTACKLIFESLK